MLGERSDQRGTLGSGPVVPGRCGAGHLLRSDGITAGAGCSGTPTSRRSTAPTTAGTACRPACWPRPPASSGAGSAAPVSRQGQRRRGQGQSGLRHPLEEPAPGHDRGWALGIEVEDRPFAKSTLQVFRAQLILHDKVREVFESSLRLARESGYPRPTPGQALKKRSMKVALDTTNILGRGAVKDTCNLLADGIVQLIRALAQLKGINVGTMGEESGIPSIPGFQRERRGRHRLERQTGPDGAAGRDCGRRGPAAGVVAAGAGGVGGGQR